MASLKWNNLIGQDRVKNVIGSAFRSGTLGHAYLFSGGRGTGKFAAALDLAMAVHCRGEGVRACGECPPCKRIGAYSYPDFNVIMPLVLRDDLKKGGDISDKGWEFMAESAKRRIDDPYRLPQYDSVPNIPVEWIREATLAIRRGGTEGAFNTAIIDGVDTMNRESANAMLKTLEEPPPGTVMILLTDNIHAVLPTIVSRCQSIRFAPLPPDVISAELSRRFSAGANDPRVAAAAAGGSMGAAIEEFENPRTEHFITAATLWNDCLQGNWASAAQSAERLSSGKEAFFECQKILRCMMELIRFAIFRNCGAPINYFNMGESCKIDLPKSVTPNDAERYAKLCQGAITDINARGNAMMIMVNLVCTLMETLNGEKQ